MANTPVAGFPFPMPSRGGNVVDFELVGDRKLAKAFTRYEKAMPGVKIAMLTELGLFGEYETKIRTPVDFGPLRASIGHYRNEPIESPNGDDLTVGDIRNATIFRVAPGLVEWGSGLHYAEHVEHGFTVSQRRLVYIERVGFRWIRPFSYRGAHMFHLGLAATVAAAPSIMSRTVIATWKQIVE